MFNSFGAPVFHVDTLGTVRDAAGFSTGIRVQYNTFDSSRLVGMGGHDIGLTLRQDRVFDRWNQPLNMTIRPLEPMIKPLEPIIKQFKPAFDPLDFGPKKKEWWER